MRSSEETKAQPPIATPDIPPPTRPPRLPKQPELNESRSWKNWITGKRLVLELVAVIGLPLAGYQIRPVLTVSSHEPSDLHGANGVKATISVSGTGIRGVYVQCVTNKVIFRKKGTLTLEHFAKIEEYSVPDVSAGESFVGDCNFSWSMATQNENGFFFMGGGASGKPQLGIPFLLKDGEIYIPRGVPIPAAVITDASLYTFSEVAAIDGTFIIVYRPFWWFTQTRKIHVIASRDVSNVLKWRLAPDSEPIIPDSASGFIVTASGPEDNWGITMKSSGATN